MGALSEQELSNWLAIYAATGLCCAIAFGLTTIVWIRQITREQGWSHIDGPIAAVAFAARAWWRWQLLYLTAAPVTLIIVTWFGFTLNWR